MNNEELIKLAKFIHKFETDYEYRDYLSENYENEEIRKIAYKIACDSIDWVYFEISEKEKFNDLYLNKFAIENNQVCTNMRKIKEEIINEDIAKLIIKTAKDSNFLNDYKKLFNILNK
ncbi:MAG: hypothetical protein H7263_06980 [Candidatus Sericytochromatia bacterium]|nr:hypothetical protein [Candidatus Sericytochromatia bacterium]